MSEPNGLNLSLNVFINKQKSNVLFAEANSDVVDILLSFLALPLGKIVRILDKNYSNEAHVVGSLTSLYRGLSKLDANHFYAGGAKQMLLNPRSSLESEICRLRFDISECKDEKYFICQQTCMNINMHSDIAKCECGQSLNREILAGDYVAGCGDGEAFTIKESSFIICDDLRVVPIVTGFLQTLNSLGITEADEAEMRSVNLDIDNIMDLLKFSLISETPLSDLIIKDRKMSYTLVKPEPVAKNDSNSTKMILRVSLQKSSNKFLFAQATNEFLDLLFSFLTVPLGEVEHLLGGKTSLKSIENLYMNVTDLISDNYFITPDTKKRIKTPKLAHGYITKNQLLALCEDSPPLVYYRSEWNYRYNIYHPVRNTFYHKKSSSANFSLFKWIKGNGKFVKEQKMCIVSDDLSVTPYSIASGISILNGLGIPLSNVREMELHIGLEEALSILKASLTSRTAITDALINKLPKLQYQRKPLIQLVGQII